jgi:hypothetical protein
LNPRLGAWQWDFQTSSWSYGHWTFLTLDCAVRWKRVNRHFNTIDLAGGNLWNRHWLECGFNQSAFRIRPTRCINVHKGLCLHTFFFCK